jgi:hypothetical protein
VTLGWLRFCAPPQFLCSLRVDVWDQHMPKHKC